MNNTFGVYLKKHRQRCTDPLTEKSLSQERLGELIGNVIGGRGYSGAAVSNWERGESKIHADDRLVLRAIISVLRQCGGLTNVDEANGLLHAGNYRALDEEEQAAIFGPEETERTNRQSLPSPSPPPAPQKPHDSLDRRRELILLGKVRRFWIEGVLEDSLGGFATIELQAEAVSDAVLNVWGNMTTPPPGPLTYTLDHETLTDLYASSGAALLILGSPGAGKTFTLLRLTQQLLERAEADPQRPVPVVLNLSSWAEKEESLGEWVLEELATKYQIPRKFGRNWLENDRLILMLDGLDEVLDRARAGCIDAVNRFRQEFGFTGIVICSRMSSYRATTGQLMLETAIKIRRLDSEQIDQALHEAGFGDDIIRQILEDERIGPVVQSPLVLRVLASLQNEDDGFRRPAASEENLNDRDAFLSALIDGYVEQKLSETQADEAFQPHRTKQWLGWLAARMAEHNQTVLYVERIQPSWLPSFGWKRFYMYVTRLMDGAMAGIILWLLLLQLRFVHPELPIGATRSLAFGADMPLAMREFIWLVGSNILLGAVVATVEIIFYERKPLAGVSRLTHHQQHLAQIVVVGILVALVAYAIGARLGDPLLIAFWSLVQAIVHMLMARFIHGANYRTEFRNMNAIAWSWRRTGFGLVAGLLMAIFAELLEYGYGVDNGTWPTFLAYGTAGVLLGGLSGQRIEKKERPNQGMRQAAANALLATGIAAPALGLVTFSLWNMTSLQITMALILFSAFTFFGGSAIFNHLLLRLIFWYDDLIPGDLVKLLDQATTHSLMRKVGGGYIFAHPLIQDHFRRMNRKDND